MCIASVAIAGFLDGAVGMKINAGREEATTAKSATSRLGKTLTSAFLLLPICGKPFQQEAHARNVRHCPLVSFKNFHLLPLPLGLQLVRLSCNDSSRVSFVP
jgi:hypothetical protein